MFGRWSTAKTWNVLNCQAMNAWASLCKSEDSPGLLLLAYTMFGHRSTAKTWNVLNCQAMNARASQCKSEDSPGLLLLVYTMFGRLSTVTNLKRIELSSNKCSGKPMSK